jgi:hypothetical protein
MQVRSRRSILLLAALVLSALACSDSTAPSDNQDVFTGQFSLDRADDRPLPAIVFSGEIAVPSPDPTFELEIVATSGTISIAANGHYEQRVAHDVYIDRVKNGGLAHADHGDCVRSGNQLQCESTYLEGVTFTALVSGKTLVISQDLAGEGHVATYRYSWVGSIQ